MQLLGGRPEWHPYVQPQWADPSLGVQTYHRTHTSWLLHQDYLLYIVVLLPEPFTSEIETSYVIYICCAALPTYAQLFYVNHIWPTGALMIAVHDLHWSRNEAHWLGGRVCFQDSPWPGVVFSNLSTLCIQTTIVQWSLARQLSWNCDNSRRKKSSCHMKPWRGKYIQKGKICNTLNIHFSPSHNPKNN